MQLSEDSIFSVLTAAFAKEMDFRLTRIRPKSATSSGDDFFDNIRILLESSVNYAKALRDMTSLIDSAIDQNALHWDCNNETNLKRRFVDWSEYSEQIREFLPACMKSRKFSDLVSSFLRADEFVSGWLAKQEAYENGVLELELPEKLPLGGPTESWYLESFERTF